MMKEQNDFLKQQINEQKLINKEKEEAKVLMDSLSHQKSEEIKKEEIKKV